MGWRSVTNSGTKTVYERRSLLGHPDNSGTLCLGLETRPRFGVAPLAGCRTELPKSVQTRAVKFEILWLRSCLLV